MGGTSAFERSASRFELAGDRPLRGNLLGGRCGGLVQGRRPALSIARGVGEGETQPDADPIVPLGQSELLHAALKKAGVESELVVIKGGGHGGAGFGTPEMQQKLAAFFDKHLKKR